MKNIFFATLLMLLTPLCSGAEIAPEQLIRTTTDKIVILLKANRDTYTKDNKKLYAMVDEHVLPNFDFRVMSRSVLGRYWREATEEQRGQFTQGFRDLLVRTYATALLKYTNQEIAYLPYHGKPNDKTVTVKTEVKQPGSGLTIPIHYSLFKTNSDAQAGVAGGQQAKTTAWKVYDISIEGVSLVTNYRSTYSDVIQKQGLDGLIANLTKKNKESVDGKSGTKDVPSASSKAAARDD